MQNRNALAEIQQKYAGCNLLMPASTEIQLNPFYKITVMEVPVDLSENSGDVVRVGFIKVGRQNDKDIYEDTFFSCKTPINEIGSCGRDSV